LSLDPTHGVALFTDGSCWTGDRIGGWAWLALDPEEGFEQGYGWDLDTTNNRMEMIAWAEGLEWLHELHGPLTVLVYSDSEYVGFGVENRSRQRKKNVDLWGRVFSAVDAHRHVEFCHVKGHGDSHYNDLVDKMAGEARLHGQAMVAAAEMEQG
jgi:ribonuclease HI